MCPDELDRLFHQGSHTDGRFHVIGEDKEGTASGNYTSVQRHTDADTSHGQLCYTGLEEGTTEVTFYQRMGLFQETVGLVGVGEVGRSTDHILYLSSQNTQYGS